MSSIPLPALGIKPPEINDSLEQYGKVVQLKSLMQQQQTGQLQQTALGQENQQRQMQLNDQKVIMDAYKKANGNLDQTIQFAAQSGVSNPQTLIALKKASVEQEMQNIDLVQKKGVQAVQEANLYQGAHDAVAKAPAEAKPQVYQQQLQALQQAGIDVSQMPPQYPGDQQFELLGHGVTDHKQQVEEIFKAAETAKNKAQAEAEKASAEKTGMEIAGTLPMSVAQQGQQKLEAAKVRIEAGRLSEEQRHNKVVEGSLSDDGLNIAADNYAKTGQMPTGMRSAAMVSKIINRAAQLNPGGLDLASNKAAYKANSDALVKLQVQRDAVGAFENTANKNLDLFLSQAKNVVDTGSPFLNTPLRMVSAKMLGDKDVAAYNAARQVAINEIAKVTSNPNLTGTLSDSARHEIENFNPENATLAQTYKVASVLKQDMANRHDALDQQIGDIKKRIAGKSAAPAAQPQGAGGFNWNDHPVVK